MLFNKLNPAVIFIMLLVFLAPADASEGIGGVWKRDGGDGGKLEFFDCKGKLCARGVVPLPDGSPPPLIIRNASKVGENSWKGDLYNPEDGKIYGGRVVLNSPSKLTLTGCLMELLCQSEGFIRVTGPVSGKAGKTEENAIPNNSAPSTEE